MKKDIILSRRKFLVGSAGALGAGALAVVGGTGSLIKPSTAHATAIVLPLPLPDATLDPQQCAEFAFNHYRGNGEG